mgnify:CR=1 FL=1
MTLTPRKLNTYTMYKLPAAYLCGVRTKHIDNETCIVGVTHKWVNKNPFKSMFWAVQGMAAEFYTGALMINKIQESGKPVSMLVTSNNCLLYLSDAADEEDSVATGAGQRLEKITA